MTRDMPYQCNRVIIRNEIATLAEARHLFVLLQRGMVIWCCYKMPEQWLALQAVDTDEVGRLRDRFRRAVERGQVRDACRQTWQDVLKSHQSVRPTGTGTLSFQHRRIQGAEVYLLTSWEEPFRGQVSFPHASMLPEIWCAETGKTQVAKNRTVRGDRISITTELGKNDSKIVVFSPADSGAM